MLRGMIRGVLVKLEDKLMYVTDDTLQSIIRDSSSFAEHHCRAAEKLQRLQKGALAVKTLRDQCCQW